MAINLWLLENYRKLKSQDEQVRAYFTEQCNLLLASQPTLCSKVPLCWIDEGVIPLSYTMDLSEDNHAECTSHQVSRDGNALVVPDGTEENAHVVSSGVDVAPPPSQNIFRIYFDGSCPMNDKPVETRLGAGWGFMVTLNNKYMEERFGPVILDKFSPWFIGAENYSNNSGELSALYESLLFFQVHSNPGDVLCLVYDSIFAAWTSVGFYSNKAHGRLVNKIQELIYDIRQNNTIHLIHVKGHLGNEYNEIADFLAGHGANNGISENHRHFDGTEERFADWLRNGLSQGRLLLRNTTRDGEGKPYVKQFVPLKPKTSGVARVARPVPKTDPRQDAFDRSEMISRAIGTRPIKRFTRGFNIPKD